MPRAKYTKPPGPLPAIEQIQRAQFRFRDNQWSKLAKLLPCKLADLGVPPAETLPNKVKTIADWVVHLTETEINSHLTTTPLILEAQINPANVRAAIRRLREALRPFARGWVDNETADLIPTDLDAKLAARDQQISKMHLPPAPRRMLAALCQRVEVLVRRFSSASGGIVSEQDMLRYIDAALTFARIKHPNISKHRNRLAALVFPNS